MTPPIYKTVPYAIDPIVPLVLREDPPAPATFTQDEVNGFLAKEKNAILERFKDYDAIKEQAGKVGELAQQVADLTNAAELADKSKEEQAQIIAQRAAAQSEAEIAGLRQQVIDLTGSAEQATGALHTFRMSTHVGSALATAGVLPSAAAHAQAAMLADVEIKLGDDGKIAGIVYGEVPQKDLAAASSKWPAANPHFKAATKGGGGTEQPTGGTLSTEDRDNMSADELASDGWNRKPVPIATGGPQFDE